MRKLFKSTQTTYPINKPTNFPSGIAVKTESGTYWIRDGKKYKLVSDRAEKTWSFVTVLATDLAISEIKLAGKLGFRDGALIKNIADGKIYLISQNKRRHITTPDFFNQFGFDKNSIIEVSDLETNMHNLGENI